MSVCVQCGACEQRYQATDEMEGRDARCPNCGESIDVPLAFDEMSDEDRQLPVLDDSYAEKRSAPASQVMPVPDKSDSRFESLNAASGVPVGEGLALFGGWLILVFLVWAIYAYVRFELVQSFGVALSLVSGLSFTAFLVGYLPDKFRAFGMLLMMLTGLIGIVLVLRVGPVYPW